MLRSKLQSFAEQEQTVQESGSGGGKQQDSADLFNFETMEQPGLVPPSRKRASTEPTICSDIKKPVTRDTEILNIESYHADSNMPKAESSTGDCEVGMSTQHGIQTNLFDDIYSSAREVLDRIQDQIENKS